MIGHAFVVPDHAFVVFGQQMSVILQYHGLLPLDLRRLGQDAADVVELIVFPVSVHALDPVRRNEFFASVPARALLFRAFAVVLLPAFLNSISVLSPAIAARKRSGSVFLSPSSSVSSLAATSSIPSGT